jgi:hypothetical protein
MPYPHGFTGAKLNYHEPAAVSDTAEAFGAMLADGGVIMPNSVKPYNRGINHLTKFLLSGSSHALTFDFRKKVLEAALPAWGTMDIAEWYEIQFSNPEFGDIHQRFLDDCFRFIETGEREIEPEFWYKILADEYDRTDSPGSITRAAFGSGFGDQATRFFKSVNTYLPQVICRWTAQRDGFDDMLMSLNVLFGT